jgi:hypothetical protein
MYANRKHLALVTAILCLFPAFVRADGGVTFTNIAANDGAGITYRRVGTPGRLAVADALFNQLLPASVPVNTWAARTPQKAHGAPGVAVFDFDNDGDLDIYVTNGPGKANSLYSNQLKETGRVSFIDVAETAGVTATSQDSSGVCFGDLDNDAFQDLYVTGIGEDNILYHNNGNGTFTDITATAGIAAGSAHHSGCAMGDFNADGLLDIAISNTYNSWDRRDPQFVQALDPALEPNQLFMQDRSNSNKIHFVDASATSGIQKIVGLPGGSFTWSVAAVDINQDGYTDILFTDVQGLFPPDPSKDRGYNRLFLNDGTGHFTDVSYQVKLNKNGSWMGLAFGDFNCDGNMDFFSTNIGPWLGNLESQARWFLGNKDGTFEDPGVGDLKAIPFGWGAVATDYDNDGDQDIIYYGDDDVLTVIAMDNPGTILQNPGCSAKFKLDLNALKTDHRLREVNGVAKGDFNNDGFEDIATVAQFRIVPQPEWHFPFYLVPAVGKFGTPLDDIATIEVQMTGRLNPGTLTYTHPKILRGDLAIEMNSANNGNGWVAVQAVGSFGTLPKAKSNRDGIGAVLKFTPEGGKTVITPIIGGGSHASQSYLNAEFGLGSASKGMVDILWPGGTRNRLYDVANGERVKVPEIPCSYSASWRNADQYNACVRDALNRLTQAKVISRAERNRLFSSAARAFAER